MAFHNEVCFAREKNYIKFALMGTTFFFLLKHKSQNNERKLSD